MFLDSIFRLRQHHLIETEQTAKDEANMKVIQIFDIIMLSALVTAI